MATGGTGDVLAGILGSLLAQGCAPFEAACLAVWLHGVAASTFASALGDAGLLAGDLPCEVPRIRRHLARARRARARAASAAGVRATADRRLKGRAAPIEARLAAAGLPPLPRAAPGWRSTPTRWQSTCASCARSCGRGRGSRRS